MTLLFLCLYVLLCGVKTNMAKYPWVILLQNILISNPIMGFHLVCTLDVHKKKKQNKKGGKNGVTDRKKTFPITVLSPLPLLICLTGDSMDF